MVAGRMEFSRPSGVTRFAAGDVLRSISPGDESTCVIDHARIQTVSLSAKALHALTANDDDPRPWRFLDRAPSEHGRVEWRRLTEHVRHVLADPLLSTSPLVVGATVDALAAAALAIFPNDSSMAAPPQAPERVSPTAVRRAIDYIDAHPDSVLTLGDIAREAGLSPRAVQLGFRRELGTTPMTYLRTVRLRHAHASLQAAVPGDGTTVSRIAADWGFDSSSRFAARYRAAYGCSPGETLADLSAS